MSIFVMIILGLPKAFREVFRVIDCKIYQCRWNKNNNKQIKLEHIVSSQEM